MRPTVNLKMWREILMRSFSATPLGKAHGLRLQGACQASSRRCDIPCCFCGWWHRSGECKASHYKMMELEKMRQRQKYQKHVIYCLASRGQPKLVAKRLKLTGCRYRKKRYIFCSNGSNVHFVKLGLILSNNVHEIMGVATVSLTLNPTSELRNVANQQPTASAQFHRRPTAKTNRIAEVVQPKFFGFAAL